MFNRGLVTLSADPIHYGHIDLIRLAKTHCQELLVVVSDNDDKKCSYLFSPGERTNMVRRALSGMDGVEVLACSQILPDIYLQHGCDVVFRGIRDDRDAEYERSQMSYHRMIHSAINPYYLSFRDNLYISSSIIKAFVSHHVDVSDYVPTFVKKALEERISQQYKIAVTGGMAVGKSWVADSLVRICREQLECQAVAIKFDDLIHTVYDDLAPGPQAMRKKMDYLCRGAGSSVSILKSDGTVNRSILGDFIFSCNDSNLRDEIQTLTQPFVESQYRTALRHAGPGLIVIEWAQLAEMNMGRWTNYHVIVVDSPDRSDFLARRKITHQQLEDRMKFQWSTDFKIEALLNAARRDKASGYIVDFSNTREDNKIVDLAQDVVSLFGLGV